MMEAGDFSASSCSAGARVADSFRDSMPKERNPFSPSCIGEGGGLVSFRVCSGAAEGPMRCLSAIVGTEADRVAIRGLDALPSILPAISAM